VLQALLERGDMEAFLAGQLSTLVHQQGEADGGRPLLLAQKAKPIKDKRLFAELQAETLASSYRAAESAKLQLDRLAAREKLSPAAAQLWSDVDATLRQPRSAHRGCEILGSTPSAAGAEPSGEQVPHTDGDWLAGIVCLFGARPPPLVACRADRHGGCRSLMNLKEIISLIQGADPGWRAPPPPDRRVLLLTGALLSAEPRLASPGWSVMTPGRLLLLARNTPHAGSIVPAGCLTQFIALCGDREYSGADNRPCWAVAALAGADRTAARLLVKYKARMKSILRRYDGQTTKAVMNSVCTKARQLADARNAASAASRGQPLAEATSTLWRLANSAEEKYCAAAVEFGAEMRRRYVPMAEEDAP